MSPIIAAVALVAGAWPAAAQTADPTPPIEAAVEICRGLLPGFVRAPLDLEVVPRPAEGDSPAGVLLTWTGDAADDARGGGFIRCWFLSPAQTAGQWQIATVDTSAYGTLTRYDVQQLYKLLRLRPDDPERAKVDRDSAWWPWLYGLQQAVNAASLGGLYALIAVGFTLIYASGRVINFAIGEIFAIGAFIALFSYLLHRAGGAPMAMGVLTVVAAVGVSAAGGWAMHRLVFRRLAGSGMLPPLIAAIGLSIALREVLRLLQGPKTRWLPPLDGWSWPLVRGLGFDVYASLGHLVIVVAAALAAGLLWWLGRMTRIGRSFRAAAEDPGAAELMGVPVGGVFAGTFAVGAAFAGTAGGFAAWYYGPVDFHMGALVGLKALTAAIIGGLGSLPGAFAGGVVVAIVEVGAAATIGGAWRDLIVFGLLVLFLIFRPQGLFGAAVDPFHTRRADGAAESRALGAR